MIQAVCMSPQTRKRLWKSNFQHVSVHTAQTWGDHFLMELHETCANAQKHNAHHPPPLQLAHVAAAAADTQKRLIVLGYNAALKAVSVTKGPQIRFDSLQSGISRTMCASGLQHACAPRRHRTCPRSSARTVPCRANLVFNLSSCGHVRLLQLSSNQAV